MPPEPEDLLREFLNAEEGPDREEKFRALEGALPPWMRIYDAEDGLKVYYNAYPGKFWTEKYKQLYDWLIKAANYVEAVELDGSAQVIKGGVGPTQLKKNTEPRVLTALERVLSDDDLI